MASSGVSYTFLRPQYIYGPKANKRYLDYFFARASRNMPIPLPLNGNQLVCISHVEDVAALVAQVIAAPQAMNQIFNCATDKLVSYNDLAEHCHHALGHREREDVKIAYYEPKHFEHWKGSGLQQFPFRRETFVVGVDKARLAFPDWQPKHELAEDMRELAEAYCSSAAAQEDLSMDDLRYDFELAASKDIDFMFEYPFFDDLEINSAQ
jgi:UDP-glucose 4-epimerase